MNLVSTVREFKMNNLFTMSCDGKVAYDPR